MKINTEQLRPLETDQESKARRTESGEGFGELLSQELGASEVAPATGLQPPVAPLLPHQVAAAGEVAATDASTRSPFSGRAHRSSQKRLSGTRNP